MDRRKFCKAAMAVAASTMVPVPLLSQGTSSDIIAKVCNEAFLSHWQVNDVWGENKQLLEVTAIIDKLRQDIKENGGDKYWADYEEG